MDEGFTVAFSPAQLAAVISGGTLDGQGSNWTRGWGGLKLLFGGLETLGAGALILTREPTMLTKAGGAVLGAHGIDTIQSGARQVWTGVETRTATGEGTAALAAALGVDSATARQIGEDIDTTVPLALTLGIGAVRLAAVRGGRMVVAEYDAAAASRVSALQRHEAATGSRLGGHTIARHVGQSDKALAERLATSSTPSASTFATITEAETAISKALWAKRREIATWARNARVGAKRQFTVSAGQNVGRVMFRGATRTVHGTRILFV